MSSAGHVLDMLNRAKYNRYLKEARKSKYKKVKNKYLTEIVKYKPTELKEVNLSNEELEAIKSKIRSTIKKERKTKTIRALIVSCFVILFLWSFFYILYTFWYS